MSGSHSAGYLLDTNVLSELVRKKPTREVVRRLRQLRGQELTTSAVCVMGLRHGTARHPQGGKLWQRLSQTVLPRVQVLSLGEEEARDAGDLLATLEERGVKIGLEDVLIGATARTHGLTLATRNIRHFERIDDLRVESWWPET
jgi:predicted nucleic acid-binding protein